MKINSQRVIIGLPGSGKTSLARELVAADLIAGHVVLIHDPHGEYEQLDATCYETVEAYLAHLAACVTAKQPAASLARIRGSSADPVIALAMDLAPAVGRPITLVLDEMALTAASGPTYVADRDRELMTSRRHLGHGIAPILLAQDTGIIQQLWLRLATDLYLFRNSDEARIRQIESLASVRGLRTRLPRLGDYEYLHVRPGQELDREAVA